MKGIFVSSAKLSSRSVIIWDGIGLLYMAVSAFKATAWSAEKTAAQGAEEDFLSEWREMGFHRDQPWTCAMQ